MLKNTIDKTTDIIILLRIQITKTNSLTKT